MINRPAEREASSGPGTIRALWLPYSCFLLKANGNKNGPAWITGQRKTCAVWIIVKAQFCFIYSFPIRCLTSHKWPSKLNTGRLSSGADMKDVHITHSRRLVSVFSAFSSLLYQWAGTPVSEGTQLWMEAPAAQVWYSEAANQMKADSKGGGTSLFDTVDEPKDCTKAW